ncbi:TolC family protein [Gemmata sp. JC717]|uniref:TolC family protein n=1 Tax=Gemmata algarum TaxID=2975278 RepID=UPI0021BAC28D|nr:TolC family protein [Gemmata algarum]MDY3552461.1 TolC family protein [Gemmata algarum]
MPNVPVFRFLHGCDMHGSARCLPYIAGFALLALIATPGCSRFHYRERADKDVAGVISQKNIFPDWQVKKDWHVYPDPRARFADNSNPDRPPYPPDDFAARVLSPHPQRPTKKSGVGRVDGDGYVAMLEQWDAENRAVEPPPPARGVAEQSPASAPTVKKDGGTTSQWPTTPGAGAAERTTAQHPLPRGETAGAKPAPDRPAVRHSLPPGFPGASPVEPPAAVAKQPATASGTAKVAPTAPAKSGEFGPWTAANRTTPTPSTEPGRAKLAPPTVVVVSGKDEPSGVAVPAVGRAPVVVPESVPPPDVAPAQPLPLPVPETKPPETKLPDPKPSETKLSGGNPLGAMSDLYPPALATGDPASDYLKALESAQSGYRIKLDQAVELGLFNAREYQDRREDLYLSALPVTLERFNFAAQAFFTEQVVRRSTGRELGGGERWNMSTTAGFNKLFPTGALLAVQLANQVVIDLSGDRPQTSISNLTLSLAQPFLRGGGFAVTLEGLTQAERTLLYAMRSYARFRKIFYVAIAGGGGYTNNPYGLQGLSPNLGRGIGGNLTAPSTGFMPLLYQSAVISNQRKNVTALERLLRLYQAFREGGQQSDLQVGQVEVQLLSSRGQLLGQVGGVAAGGGGGGGSGIRGYLDALDNYKLQLGLPVTVALDLDDTPLRPIRQQLGRFEEVYAQVQQVELEAAKYDPAVPVAQFRARWRALLTESPLAKGTAFAKSIGERFDSWAPAKLNDDQAATRLARLREERRKLLDARAALLAKGQPEPPADTRRVALLEDEIDLGEFDRLVRVYESQPWSKFTGPARVAAQAGAFRDVFSAFYLLILEARNDRLVLVRNQWPELPPLPIGAGQEGSTDALAAPLDEAYTAAIRAALSNRLDLMNARAQVVDSWRQIAIQANSLQGVFDVRYDLTSSTPAGRNNGLAFSADRSDHRLTFNAQLPLIRRAERNNYRAALVSYQRSRRTLMAFEDNITNDVRSDLRDLRTFAQLYRIQQRVVELGYSQVDNAQAILLAPPAPGAGNDAGSAAALTQQVLDAQSRLVAGQNSLYQIWVAYQTGRMQLYLDLEQMTLDDRGVWIDEFFNRADSSRRSPEPAGDRPRQPVGEQLPAPRPFGR